MICPECRGRGWAPLGGAADDEGAAHGPCPMCGGCGIAYCCEGAAPVFECARCGFIQENNVIRCEDCGEPLVFRIA
jgi:hypothetical protein